MKKQPMSLSDICKIPTTQLIADLRAGKYSLLQSLSCDKLRREMIVPGWISRTILYFAYLGKGPDSVRADKRARAALIRLLNFTSPYEVERGIPITDRGLVIGFNHPSLGEVLRLIAICLNYYPDKSYLFPVNLAWYEALAPVADQLEHLGIYITPMITPATVTKINKLAPEYKAEVDGFVTKFSAVYMDLCCEFIERKQIVLVAPSATRQATVFKSHDEMDGIAPINPAMSILAFCLGRDKSIGDDDYRFMPVAVVPPKNFGRGLNLFKQYQLMPLQFFTPEFAYDYCRKRYGANKGRMFEHLFLTRIAMALSDMGHDELVCPKRP